MVALHSGNGYRRKCRYGTPMSEQRLEKPLIL